MCILICKTAGAEMPPIDIIERCIDHNPDGFGFATRDRVYKTMNWLAFEEELYKVPKSEPCIIHCRWATHGSVKKSNCHPFYDEKTGVAFAHNGILWRVEPDKDMTDSETAFRRYFVPAIAKYGLDSDELKKAVANIIDGSKFAFIDKRGHMKLFGNFTNIDGCYYSNLRF